MLSAAHETPDGVRSFDGSVAINMELLAEFRTRSISWTVLAIWIIVTKTSGFTITYNRVLTDRRVWAVQTNSLLMQCQIKSD